MALVLKPKESGGRPIPIDKAIVFVGRGQECDVVLTGSRKVSRKHCCIAQIDDHFVVRDLGSLNGLRLNGAQVEREALLQPGDELCIGDVFFQAYELKKQSGKPAPKQNPQKSKAKPDPYMMSGDLPVAIPDEDEDFAVEATNAQRIPVADFADEGDDDFSVEASDVEHIPVAEFVDSDDEIIQLRDDDFA
ncbi:MAG: FHA domain-containing protein [Planctomycetaceae bacterium]|nr:FHA domain-containing protein [Planctomycetaceae bacterium]MCA9029189.1 FHA domain-containing protein [Planctomycetaceae bacterium]MCA9044094.1 FHA domain-containing protein [Planctomycetaceae bacterium]MCB9951226.1 FHA domain-containing protein [Planctomycetaceae bacterium]